MPGPIERRLRQLEGAMPEKLRLTFWTHEWAPGAPRAFETEAEAKRYGDLGRVLINRDW
jgi:hypothetical protein